MKYRLLIDFDVLEVALKLSRDQKYRLLRHFLSVKSFPGNYTDFKETDANGRVLSVSIFDDYKIRYWIDDADEQIKILRMEKK